MTQGTLVDTNVLLDVLTEGERWLSWSLDALADAAESGPIYINSEGTEIARSTLGLRANDRVLPRPSGQGRLRP